MRKKTAEEIAAWDALQAAFPLAFPLDKTRIQPLAIGIRTDVAAWAATAGISEQPAIGVLRRHCLSFAYRHKLKAGVMRITLQGTATEPVTPEAAALAVESLAHDKAARIANAVRKAANLERMAQLQAAAAARKAAKAAKPPPAPKPKKVKAKPAPAPAPVVKPVAAMIVKKKRTIVIPR